MSQSILAHKPLLSYAGDAYAGNVAKNTTSTTYTAGVTFRRFTGRLYIEGTLETNPTDNDWFIIDAGQSEFEEFSGTLGYTFKCSLMKIRMRVDREYLPDSEFDLHKHGSIAKARLSN